MPQPCTVLIVDDEPTNQETLAALLGSQGYQLVFADNGNDALRQAAATPPDLILLDVMLPGMDGFAVCKRLRTDAALADVPVIMLTALDDRDSRLAGIEAGADDFVSKPYDRVELRARVRTSTRLNRYRRLTAARARFEWVVDHSDDGYLIVAPSGAIQYANTQASAYLGAPALDANLAATFTELAGKHYELRPPVAWSDWLKLAADMMPLPRFLIQPESAQADTCILQVDLLAMAPDAEQHYLIRLRDITTTVVDQQTAWTFQSLIRHKLSTALAQLLGGLQLINGLRLAPAQGALAELLRIVAHGAARLEADVSDIYQYIEAPDMLRPEQGRCALADLPEIVAAANARLEIASIRVDARAADATPPIDLAISHSALGLIITELFENARKFHPRQSPTIDVVATHDRDTIHLHIRDDGQSLAPAQLARAWQPYFQGERYFTGQVPGMGLGLPLVATLIWRVGGTCRMHNRAPGPGMDVELIIPIAAWV